MGSETLAIPAGTALKAPDARQTFVAEIKGTQKRRAQARNSCAWTFGSRLCLAQWIFAVPSRTVGWNVNDTSIGQLRNCS